ncbi:Gfo/Idh/MocA family protein [Cohnella sp. GCM10027633]|uniref:Gfo/Idh/MocA family protein n=1 Tax=unclassified Cohnella TaxID=2636738 RepID=UPI003631E703
MTGKIHRIGIIGLGGMANAHVEGLMNHAPRTKVTALCDVSASALESFGARLGVASDNRFSDYRDLIACEEVDAVISVTPNVVHAEIMALCVQAGKPFLSEKPFVMTMEEAERVRGLYADAPVPAMIGFSYRYTPAFRYARQLLQEGRIGAVRHFSSQYLQEWGAEECGVPFVWRFDKNVTGTGTLGDLGAHMIDMAHYLIGPFEELSARLQTLVAERKDPATGAPVRVEVDDLACFQAVMKNGAVGIFQTTRNAIGSGNQHEISLYGDNGTIHASTERPDRLVWIHRDPDTGERVERILNVPYAIRLSQWADFARLLDGEPADGLPDFMAGYENQRVLEAIVRSHELKRTVAIGESEGESA